MEGVVTISLSSITWNGLFWRRANPNANDPPIGKFLSRIFFVPVSLVYLRSFLCSESTNRSSGIFRISGYIPSRISSTPYYPISSNLANLVYTMVKLWKQFLHGVKELRLNLGISNKSWNYSHWLDTEEG